MSFELLHIERICNFDLIALSAFERLPSHVYIEMLSFWTAANAHSELHLSSGS